MDDETQTLEPFGCYGRGKSLECATTAAMMARYGVDAVRGAGWCRLELSEPDWLKQACEEPVCLFLDEVDRATLEVRQGIFELTDSRKLNGHNLHPDTIIFAAVNGGEHGEQYQVNEMDPAELDRWSVWDIEPTVEDWLAWAKENVDSLIWDFINQNRGHLEHNGDIEPNKRYPSRRSWEQWRGGAHHGADALLRLSLIHI